jgi:hypothetical protein
MSKNYVQQIEKFLNKLLGKNICSCTSEETWDESHWYYDLFDKGDEWRRRYACTECFVRDSLIELVHKCIVGNVQVKTVIKVIIKVHNYTNEYDEEKDTYKELDNLEIIEFSNFLTIAKEKAKEKKELTKMKKKYKKYLKQKRAKRRKLWLIRKEKSFAIGGTD